MYIYIFTWLVATTVKSADWVAIYYSWFAYLLSDTVTHKGSVEYYFNMRPEENLVYKLIHLYDVHHSSRVSIPGRLSHFYRFKLSYCDCRIAPIRKET